MGKKILELDHQHEPDMVDSDLSPSPAWRGLSLREPSRVGARVSEEEEERVLYRPLLSSLTFSLAHEQSGLTSCRLLVDTPRLKHKMTRYKRRHH